MLQLRVLEKAEYLAEPLWRREGKEGEIRKSEEQRFGSLLTKEKISARRRKRVIP